MKGVEIIGGWLHVDDRQFHVLLTKISDNPTNTMKVPIAMFASSALLFFL